MARTLIVSNRLPVTVKTAGDDVLVEPSTGGLATGLAPLAKAGELEWIGWAGTHGRHRAATLARIDDALARRRLVGVPLKADEIEGFYNQFSNGILWPLYHYEIQRMPLILAGWDAYRRANERFADVVAERWRPGDLVWVHDYHLQLLPKLLRERRPEARIGFFLHVPFPSSEVFRVLPWRAQILDGILGADLVGFHTHAYARHFVSSVVRVLGAQAAGAYVDHDGRKVRVGAFPLGVDAPGEAAADAVESDLAHSLKSLREEGRIPHLLLAIDRLDYTKGIPRRLLALEALLEAHAELRGKVVLVQIAAPSRDDVPAYGKNKRQVEELVGRINGRFGWPGYQPIHYVSRAFAPSEVRLLYRLVDVMVVTPLRDGMNLVAKEFIAARTDGGGALVLSEFAGAAAELGEAIHVNPYDIAQTAEGIHGALMMSRDEKAARMKALRERVTRFDAATWGGRFLTQLARRPKAEEAPRYLTAAELQASLPKERKLVLFLDYDGTLCPIVRIPDLAVPSSDLLQLLSRLGRSEACEVHLLSGRSAAFLDRWFDGLGLHLHAEHGAKSRGPSEDAWQTCVTHGAAAEWMGHVRGVVEDFAQNTPGSFIETKSHSIAWHYRMADPEHGERMANELFLHARESFAQLGLDVLPGKKVLEIRPAGISKGRVVRSVLAGAPPEASVVAIGDDVTDEDMFTELGGRGLSVVVGERPSRARARVRDHFEVRRLLELIDREVSAGSDVARASRS